MPAQFISLLQGAVGGFLGGFFLGETPILSKRPGQPLQINVLVPVSTGAGVYFIYTLISGADASWMYGILIGAGAAWLQTKVLY